MKNICACNNVSELKVEGDFGADALWCGVCDYNLDIAVLPISQHLKTALIAWAHDYGTWLDMTHAKQAQPRIVLHNATGQTLTAAVQKEFPTYDVWFKATNAFT